MDKEINGIEQLAQYRQKQARIKVLSSYSVGAGITVSRLNEDDQLQELHRKLRGLPSYMYLSAREQRLETVAHTYLGGRYPAGIQMQQKAVPARGGDAEDEKLLRELHDKIGKVIAARGYDIRDDLDAVLERVAELQDLQTEVQRVEDALEALASYKPDYARLLRLLYVEGVEPGEARARLEVSARTFRRRYTEAETEYLKLTR